ncbi:MAG: response regulator [Planctomycetes bacterium]|nr:response regulator [Planctomycetota bacterium]
MMFKLSFVVKGVENKLTEMGYSITEQVSNLRNVGNWQNIELFVLYLSEGIVEDPRKLETVSHVCQFVHANKKPMIVIGEWNRHDALSQTVPAIDWFRWVDRPIDIEKFSGIVTQVVAAAANGDRKKRILIVDDDPYYARLVSGWVRDSYRADVVLEGTQAFDYLLKNVGDDDKVDLVLLDYEMPGVDGPQVLQMLRQDPRTANIPVVFLTGVGTKEAVMRVKGLRPDGYILKSTSKEALLDCLKDKLKD